MKMSAPHFLLFSEARTRNNQGEWKIALQAADGSAKFEITETEPCVHGERLELLAVVRGLESLDQPSTVTLVTSSRYVARGLAYGLEEWRRTGWMWERFGEMVPIKNADLWQRLDRAAQIHRLENRTLRFDPPHRPEIQPRGPHFALAPRDTQREVLPNVADAPYFRPAIQRLARWIKESWESTRLAVAQFGAGLLPSPWLG